MASTQDPSAGGFHFDKTINVPTILTVISMTVGAAAFGVRAYIDLDSRIVEANRVAVLAREEVRRVDGQVGTQGQNQGGQVKSLREEVRGELRDMNQKLDRILFDLATNNSRKRD